MRRYSSTPEWKKSLLRRRKRWGDNVADANSQDNTYSYILILPSETTSFRPGNAPLRSRICREFDGAEGSGALLIPSHLSLALIRSRSLLPKLLPPFFLPMHFVASSTKNLWRITEGYGNEWNRSSFLLSSDQCGKFQQCWEIVRSTPLFL